MIIGNYKQWQNKPEVESTLAGRAQKNLPEMECTKQLVELISKIYKPGMRVLDVGCNVGHYLVGLRRLDAKLSYTGVDAYEYYIKQAKEIFREDSYAKFEVKDILEPIFEDNPFDIVFCCNVILHLPDFRLPVRNLLNSTKNVCIIRTLLGKKTSIVKKAIIEKFDNIGNPLEFIYQNTWDSDYFANFINELGFNIELIDDKFDPLLLQEEYVKIKDGEGTTVINNKQIDDNIIFNWKWIKITPKCVLFS